LRKGIGAVQGLVSESRALVSPQVASVSHPAERVPLFLDKYFVAGVVLREPGLVVYRAAHSLLKSELFLFLPERTVDADAPLGQLLVQQAMRVGAIENRALPRVHDLGFFQNCPYLVTDAVEGRDLKRVASSAAGPHPADAVRMVAELARALAAIHEQGLVHGHICPSWILVDRDDRPHLLGTGVPWLAQTISEASHAFAPGEITFRVEPGDAASDVWALGSSLHLLLTGREAAPGEAVAAANIPKRFLRPLERALAANASQRPTAADWATLLERAAAGRNVARIALFTAAVLGVGTAVCLALAR
jgi:serine/threonine protein kinase